MPVRTRKATTTLSRTIPSAGTSITAFAKVTKSHTATKVTYDKLGCHEANLLVTNVNPSKKRKLDAIEIKVELATESEVAATRSSKRRAIDPQDAPAAPEVPAPVSPSNLTLRTLRTTTTTTRKVLSRPAESAQGEHSAHTEIYSYSYESAADSQAVKQDGRVLPDELSDLVSLHSAFLTALTLFYAHNGVHTPADLRNLCPDVSRTWGKRRVVLLDIRRILGLLHWNHVGKKRSSDLPIVQLNLSDYGLGKICIELKDNTTKGTKAIQPLDEDRLNGIFSDNLRDLWNARNCDGELDISQFLAGLPLEPIVPCPSLTKISPLLEKGQRRLEDLKLGIKVKKEAEEEKVKAIPAAVAKGPLPSLLERLRAKQLLQASLPAPPTKEELARRAGLHRLEEVVGVLSVLTTSTSLGQARVSFTMPTVLEKLKDSLRSPISREEGETCVKLLASDIAPEWLKVVKMGKSQAVVVNRPSRPGDMDLKLRIERALG